MLAGTIAAAIALIAVGAAHAANTRTLPDAAGDRGTGPDISQVSVSSDGVGTVSFQVELANRPSLTPGLARRAHPQCHGRRARRPDRVRRSLSGS
jgi:hypothetical protein